MIGGLAAKSTARPDMPTLLALLERGLARRSTWLAVGLGAGLAALLGFALGERAPRCEGAGEAMAGLWDEAARAGLTATLRASDRPYAADTARTVDELITGYVTAWAGLQRESCEAHTRGEISPGLLDQRSMCLLERRADLAQLIDALGHADTATVEKAVAAARSLEPVEHCRDPGASHPRAAEALVELAELERGAGELDAAVGHLDRAAQIVEAGEVQPGETGRTLFALARAVHERDPGRAATLIGRATELSERAGPSGSELRAELVSWRAAHP